MRDRSPGKWLAVRTAVRLQLLIGGSNVAGGILVFVYLSYLSPNTLPPTAAVSQGLWTTIFASYLVAALIAGSYLGKRMFTPTWNWLSEERDPTPKERHSVLLQPLKQVQLCFVFWSLAATLFGTLNLIWGAHPMGIFRVVAGILLGGLTTCALAYLLTERTFRPIFALALEGESPKQARSPGIGPRLLLSWALGSGIPLVGIALALIGPERTDPGQATRLIFLAGSGLIAGGLMTAIAAKSVAEPIEKVRGALRRVQMGDTATQISVDDGGEAGMLQAGFNQMVAGLRERERIQELFGRYVGTEVARRAVEEGIRLEGEQKDASIVFVDLIDSTGLAEAREAGEVVSHLNAMFEAVAKAIADEGGWVNKFEGDGAMCVFGAPVEQSDHAARALRAARRMREELVSLSVTYPGLDVGVGISSGKVVAGNVGAINRFEYTVIGDPVNEAARLTEEAKRRPGRVLVARTTIERAGDEARFWTEAETVTLRGRSRPTLAYEPGVSPARAR